MAYSLGTVVRNILMIKKSDWRCIAALLASSITYSSVLAAPVWVSDVFEITLRTGPSSGNVILLMVPSGTELTVLEYDEQSGYARVQTTGGTEGWVLSRYLMDEPAARDQLDAVAKQLASTEAHGENIGLELATINEEYDKIIGSLQKLEQDNVRLESEIREITEKAGNVIAIDRQNNELQQKLTGAEIQINVLEEEKNSLLNQSSRKWFFVGALVLFGGVLLGLIFPHLKFRGRARYDRF